MGRAWDTELQFYIMSLWFCSVSYAVHWVTSPNVILVLETSLFIDGLVTISGWIATLKTICCVSVRLYPFSALWLLRIDAIYDGMFYPFCTTTLISALVSILTREIVRVEDYDRWQRSALFFDLLSACGEVVMRSMWQLLVNDGFDAWAASLLSSEDTSSWNSGLNGLGTCF